MRKIIISFSLLSILASYFITAQAQLQPRTAGLIWDNLSYPRFSVISPSPQAGIKSVTLAPWAGQVGIPLINMPVARGLDSLAALPLTNASAVSGKICLLYRGGGISFAQKVQYAQTAGAVGVIIVNNIPGEPQGMGNTGTATYTIPAVMVSDVVGNAMNNALRGSTAVNVTLSKWRLGAVHDLALLPGYQSIPHAMSIPLSQLSKGAGRQPYKNFTAGGVVNFGTSSETNITVADSVVWTPGSGPASTVHQGSYNVSFIGSTDSVRFGFGNSSSSYSLPAPGSTGSYTYYHRLSYPNADQYPLDNVYSYTQYVTDSIFCKGTWNFTRNGPAVTLGIQPSGIGVPYSLGPLYYMADGGYAARKLQFSILVSGAPTLVGQEAFALLYKWQDGSNGQALDSFINAKELKLVGVSYKAFTTADTSGVPIVMPIRDPSNPSKTVVLDSNAWYWSAAQSTPLGYIGVDESVSVFARTYEQSQVFNYQEHPMIMYPKDYTDLPNETTDVFTFPFGGHAYLIDSTYFDRFYYVPAIALHISKSKLSTGVNNGPFPKLGEVLVYPNPARDRITVDVHLGRMHRKVAYRLLDIGGRVVYKNDKESVQNDRVIIPASGIAPGIYYLLVIADGDITSREVVIQQ